MTNNDFNSQTQSNVHSAYNNPQVANSYFNEFYDDAYINSGLFEKFLASATSNGGGYTLLELGCGCGQFCEYASKKGFEVTGIDFAEAMINIAKEKQKETHSHINYICGDILKINDYFPTSQEFDIIIMPFSLLCFTPKEATKVFKIVKSKLKNNGRFLVITALETEQNLKVGRELTPPENYDKTETQYYKYYTPNELELLLKQFGFKDIEIETRSTTSENDASSGALIATATLEKQNKMEKPEESSPN